MLPIVGALKRSGAQSALLSQTMGLLSRFVSNSSEALQASKQASPAKQAVAAKPPLYKEFQIYRCDARKLRHLMLCSTEHPQRHAAAPVWFNACN